MRIVLFALPVVGMFSGLIVSLAYGVVAILRSTGRDRRNTVLKSLLGVVIFGVGIAPHSLAILMPIISYKDHANYAGTIKHVGELAPEFQITCIDGTAFQLGDSQGQVIVINFFATWCGPCQDELPHLESIWKEFQNNKRVPNARSRSRGIG